MSLYAGLYAPGTLALDNSDGTLSPAASASVTILDASSDVPTYYTNRVKGGTIPSPGLTTDASGNWGPYWLDPGNYTYSVVDAGGHSHGPYDFTVFPDPAEPAVIVIPPTEDPGNEGQLWNNDGVAAFSAG